MKSSLNLVLLLSFFVTLISPHQAWSVINLTEEECKATNLDQASQDFCDKLCKVADIPACSPHNEAPDACNGFCCPGTKLVGGVCKDPSIIDQGISRCKTNADCGGGMGCFDAENDETAMFLSQSQNPADVDEQEKQHDDMDSERDAPEGKDIGAKCNLHRECKTFLCEKLTPGRKVEPTCSPKGICRLGNVGDAAPGSIQCEPNLIKPQGICQPKQMDALLIPAPITDANPIDTGKCQFELPAQVKNNAIFAMKSVRAMEWLFATSAVGPGDECIGATTYMKEIIIKDYLDKRKDLLKNFNVKLNQLEKDYILLVAAKKGSTLPVSIHESDKDLPDENGNTQPLVEGAIAERMTSGYDNIMMMWRRNILMKDYETAMITLTRQLAVKVAELHTNMATWDNKEKSWLVAQGQSGRGAFGSRKNCRTRTGWFNKKIKDRWNMKYQVDGRAPSVKEVVSLPVVSTHLGLIGIMSHAEVVNNFTLGQNDNDYNYFLLDPLMPGPTGFGSFGNSRPGRRYLNGNTFNQMKNAFRATMPEYFRTLKKDPNQSIDEFVFEPELVDIAVRGCLKPVQPACIGEGGLDDVLNATSCCSGKSKPNSVKCENPLDFGTSWKSCTQICEADKMGSIIAANKCIPGGQREDVLGKTNCCSGKATTSTITCEDPNDFGKSWESCTQVCEEGGDPKGQFMCAKFDAFMNEMTDIGFAQFLAYSTYERGDYKNLFKDGNVWKRKLFARYENDFKTLDVYYTSMVKYRDQQNECLEKVGAQIETHLLTDGSKGLKEGSSKTYFDSSKNKNTQTSSTKSRPRTITEANRKNFSTNLITGLSRMNSNDAGTNQDNMGSTSAGGGGGSANISAGDANAAAMANRMAVLDANRNRAAASGMDLASKDKIASDIVANISQGSKGSSGASSSSSGGGGFKLGSGTAPTLSTQDAMSGATSGASSGSGGGNASGSSAAGDAGAGGFAGVDPYAHEGLGKHTDQSGMSDEEKDHMMANLEKNKSQYNTQEDDGLFRILSKAYVRNLDKVLTKKKKSLD